MRCIKHAAAPSSPVAVTLLVALASQFGCAARDALPPENPERLTIQIHSPEFPNGGMIPSRFTCDGSDRSPPLNWSGVPENARSLVLICDDPDAPMGTWSHWVVVDLPPKVSGLKEGLPTEEAVSETSMEGSIPADSERRALQGKNDFGKFGYGGPCPPSGTHRYFFRLYAVDTTLRPPAATTRAGTLKAIQGHILAEGRLIGKYTRGDRANERNRMGRWQ